MPTREQYRKLVAAYFVAELVGTFFLVVLGDGAIAAYVVSKRSLDVFCVCFAFGVGAMIATYASSRISGAHINPAVSLAFALDGRLRWHLVPIYMLAQYTGGFLAAMVLFLTYREAIESIDGGSHSAYGSSQSTGGIFATYPASYVSPLGALLDQIVGTAILVFALIAVTDRANHGLKERHQPIAIAFVIGLICVAFSPSCGAIFNPARDVTPRLVTFILGYPNVWAPLDGLYWLLAGLLGPHIGAIIGLFGYKYTMGKALEAHRQYMQQHIQSVVVHQESDPSKPHRLTTITTTTTRR